MRTIAITLATVSAIALLFATIIFIITPGESREGSPWANTMALLSIAFAALAIAIVQLGW